ncbi:uncharacterized protein [Diadema setosum]|uniref:uncharacterized protein n=1 Tax=Diadema setosum TaxID=31175 RepID=UPI003B3A05C7
MLGTPSTVQGWKGEDIRLSCGIQEEPESVFWVKESISDGEPRTTTARFVDGNFQGVEERFDIDKNFSLVITDVNVADEGLYYCQVELKNFENFDKSVFMTVNSMASKHAIEECVTTSQSHQSRCTYQATSDTPTFNLTCVVSGFKPNISMLWQEESGKKLNSLSSQQTTLPDDSYERFETIIVSALSLNGTGQTFQCIAVGDSLMNEVSIVQITLLPIPGKQGNFGLIIGLIIGLPVALAVLFVLVGRLLQKCCPDYLPRKGCGWNPCWRRPHKPKRLHEEEELMNSPKVSVWLTEKQIQQCQEELKAHYRESKWKDTFDPISFREYFEMDEIHTNLIQRDPSTTKETPIEYGDLLTIVSSRILVQGEGGIGKTTLCAKIVWDWSHGRILQDVDMMLVVPLRDVTEGETISGIIKRYLSDSNSATQNQIDNYITENPNKVILVFDGFDEYAEHLGLHDKESSEITRILELQQYKSCKVIVTTRPWKANRLLFGNNFSEAYTSIRVEGFSKDNLSSFIKRYFEIRDKDSLAENLITVMEENDVIWINMAPFPIYCAIFCLMWNNLSEERRQETQKMQTVRQVFEEIICFLKKKNASKVCENLQNPNSIEHLKEADTAIRDISAIALNGLLHQKHSFPEEQFRKCRDAMEICCRVGILTIERVFDVPSSSVSTVSFTHKLFQDYAAGKCIEHLFTNDRATYDDLKETLLSRFEEFRYVLYFTALEKELSLDIIDSLIERSRQDYCIDVAFECHTKEAARALGDQWTDFGFHADFCKILIEKASTCQGWKGEDIRLSCGIEDEPEAVFWVKERISEDQPRTIKARFVDGNFESVEERFDIDKNFNLVITDLEIADEGHYYCQVVLNNLKDFDSSVFMTVNCK